MWKSFVEKCFVFDQGFFPSEKIDKCFNFWSFFSCIRFIYCLHFTCTKMMNNGSDRKKLNENACKTILHPLPQTSFFHLKKQNKKVGIPPPFSQTPLSSFPFSLCRVPKARNQYPGHYFIGRTDKQLPPPPLELEK